MLQHFNVFIVSGTLSFVFRMSRVYGVAPVRFLKVRNSWRMLTSLGAYVHQIITVLMICAYTVAIILLNFRENGHWSYGRKGSTTISRLTSACTVVIVLAAHSYSGLHRMQTLFTCLTQLQKITTELDRYAPRTSYEKTLRLMTIYALVSSHLAALGDTGVWMRMNAASNPDRVEYFSKTMQLILHNIKSVIAKLVVLQISLTLSNVLCSFNHLNNCLNVLIEQMRDESKSNTSSQETQKAINKIGNLYCCLQRVAHLLAASYEIVVIPLLVYCMLHLIRGMHILINTIRLLSAEHNGDLAIIQFVWVLQYFGDILMIVEPCHQSYQQIERTKLLVSKLMYYTGSNNRQLMAELDLFYQHLMINRVLFAPMDIFELNRAVLLTVFGAVVTYLVFVEQVRHG